MKATRNVVNLLMALVVVLLASATVFAGVRPSTTTNVAVEVPLQNASFEHPRMMKYGGWTTTNGIPGWQALPGSIIGVWAPYEAGYGLLTWWEGANVLFINAGGVSQSLGLKLQAMADYAFSIEWGNRRDVTGAYVALEFEAGGQVLASCTPPYSPDPGHNATITLVYHSDGSSPQVGQVMSIRVIKLDKPASTTLSQVSPITQADLDDVQVTFTDRTGTPASAFSTTQECSINIAQ